MNFGRKTLQIRLSPFVCAILRKSSSLALAVSVLFGASTDRQQVQAQLLDHAELLCTNCFFGTSDYYYCFAADDMILIGYQRVPVFNWRDKSKNYLTRVHRAWTAWSAPGQSIPISYDEKHLWVVGPERKPVKLTQDYSRDIFTNDNHCQQAVRVKH